MTFGLSFDKIILIGVIAVLIIGPDKLPQYAASFAQLLNKGRDLLKGARTRVRDEMGPEFDDVDWRKLDPRQYDPRRIIRDALLEDENTPEARRARAAATSRSRRIGGADAAAGVAGVAGVAGAAGAASVAGSAGAGSGLEAEGAADDGAAEAKSFYFDEEAT